MLDLINLPAGTVLAEKYRVTGALGAGGMGVVVAAEHIGLGNRVALKIMRPELINNENIVKRFMFEGKAATRLQSDHVARVLDVGRLSGDGLPAEGVPFMVMEFLEGHDLSHWVRTGRRFSVYEALHYIAEAGEALHQAHKSGVIHRDVKPANLFLTEREGAEPIVKILDFGISKLLEEQPSEMGLTKTTAVLGSGLYMSPEQMRSAKNVDQRTDIYALGVCLFELLCGTQPFVADTFPELCVKVNVEEPTPISKYRPDIADELASVIRRAYAREVDDRYQTIVEMMAALAPFASEATLPLISQICGGVIPAPPKPLEATVTAVATDKGLPKAKVGAMAAFFALVGAGAVGITYSSSTAEQARPDTDVGALDGGARTVSIPSSSAASLAAPSASASASASAAPSSHATVVGSASAAPAVEKPVYRKPRFRRPRPKKPPPPAVPCFKDGPNGLKIPC